MNEEEREREEREQESREAAMEALPIPHSTPLIFFGFLPLTRHQAAST